MSIKSDNWITIKAKQQEMISPFSGQLISHGEDSEKIVSYGLSSYGYDMRISSEFKIFTNALSAVIDPKKDISDSFIEFDAQKSGYVIIPPNSFVLGRSVEKFRIPRKVLCVVLGKSTYARCGLIVNVTPLEPGWRGHVTIEISNTTPLPAKVYANEGIAQVLFFESDEHCSVTYNDRQGKYQDQEAKVVLPRMLQHKLD